MKTIKGLWASATSAGSVWWFFFARIHTTDFIHGFWLTKGAKDHEIDGQLHRSARPHAQNQVLAWNKVLRDHTTYSMSGGFEPWNFGTLQILICIKHAKSSLNIPWFAYYHGLKDPGMDPVVWSYTNRNNQQDFLFFRQLGVSHLPTILNF